MNRFLRWFSAPRSALVVDRGRVFCPLRHRDVDVDGCLGCQHLDTFASSDGVGVDEVVCRPPTALWPVWEPGSSGRPLTRM